jgi:methyl-accepting chemotaxis protein
MRFVGSIRGRLFALVALCTLPMGIAVAFLIDRGVGKDIRFAEKERAGNEYQRPLLELVASLRHIGLLTAAGRSGAQEADAVTRAFEAAALADARQATSLRVTKDAMREDGRDVAALASLQSQWPPLAAALRRGERPDPAALEALLQQARRLSLVAGDTSNLILDPDLDSYYLMDLTNLAVPDTIVRLGRLAALRRDVAQGRVSRADAQIALAALAALLEEADLTRIVGSARSALAEDERFYGASESLATRMPPALARYETTAQQLIARLRAAAADPALLAPLDDPAQDALRASHELWNVASEELDALLARRIDAYRRARVIALGFALAGVAAALLVGRQLARAIVGSLERSRATAEQVAAGDLAGAGRVAAGGLASDETGALLHSLVEMAGQLTRIVAEVVSSSSAISEASANLDSTTVGLRGEAQAQTQAVADATEITREVSAATEQAAGHGVRLMEAAESTRGSMSEIESEAGAIEREMRQLSAVVSELLYAMEEMTANSQSIANAADSLRTAGDQAVGSVDDLRRSISSIEHSAVTSRDDAGEMLASAERGEMATHGSMAANQEILDAFDVLRAAIEQLQGRSSRIEQVLAVINGVGDEVGLLSLNASIIAAQSGEHGRSFAVVANEIGELARETDASSSEIAKIVSDLQQDILGVSRAVASGTDQVRRGFERAREADTTLRGLAERARASAERAREISDAAAKQSISVAAVERAAAAVHDGVIEIGSSVVEYSAAVGSIRDKVTGVDGMTKSVFSAAALQTKVSARVSKAMDELIERARALESAARLQREATGRMGSALGVFRSGAEGTDALVTELGRIVELLRERSTALSREVARFRI